MNNIKFIATLLFIAISLWWRRNHATPEQEATIRKVQRFYFYMEIVIFMIIIGIGFYTLGYTEFMKIFATRQFVIVVGIIGLTYIGNKFVEKKIIDTV